MWDLNYVSSSQVNNLKSHLYHVYIKEVFWILVKKKSTFLVVIFHTLMSVEFIPRTLNKRLFLSNSIYLLGPFYSMWRLVLRIEEVLKYERLTKLFPFYIGNEESTVRNTVHPILYNKNKLEILWGYSVSYNRVKYIFLIPKLS